MDCRAVLPVRLLVRMTGVVGLSLISLNLAPHTACAQGAPGSFTVISGPHEPILNLRVYFNNADAADTTNADQLWLGGGLGLDLTGYGVNVGIWDEGPVRPTHQELIGRVAIVDGGFISDHATHVAGTIGATGLDPAARGMAGAVHLYSRDWTNDAVEMALDAGVIDISNHSYGFLRGWTDELEWVGFSPTVDTWVGDYEAASQAGILEDPNFGKYRASKDAVDQSLSGNDFSDARGLDEVLYDNPNLLAVFSGGNDRNDIFHDHRGNDKFMTYLPTQGGPPGWYFGSGALPPSDGWDSGYDTLPNAQVAKNTLVVGSVLDHTADPHDPATISTSGFSAYGPTDDGRIKPDVVANGDQVYSSIGSGDADYQFMSGTSMASPNVAGTAALLLEHYREERSVTDVASATLKGLIIHTATDAGNPGPDYSYGYGLVNAAAAADFISSTEGLNLIMEVPYVGVEQTTMPLSYAGTDLIKVTLAWTDPAPDTLPGGGLDDPLSVLVNDLDLWLTGPDGTYYPWTLDPNNPSLSAVQTGLNHVDNVEQVLIENPPPGSYTIHIGGTLDAAYTSQDYSLMVSMSAANQWNLDGAGSYNDSANWSNNRVPDGVNAGANFLGTIGIARTVTVDSPVTVGTINFDNGNAYTIGGSATVTLETSASDARIDVANGDHTISAPLWSTGGVTVDTAAGTSLTVNTTAGYSVLQGTLSKDGAGSLELDGSLAVLGAVNHNVGVLEVGPNVLASSGGNVTIADGATLKASGVINRRVVNTGDPHTSTLEATGQMDVGVASAADGYDFDGHLEVGPHSVGLRDLDRAKVYQTHLGDQSGDGTLSSFNGIAIQPVPDFWNTFGTHEGWVTGHGTIHGDVRLEADTQTGDMAAVAGDGPNDMIVFDGIVSGSGWFEYVQITGLHRPGASAGFTVLGRGVDFAPATSMEILGPLGFDVPDHADDAQRGYDQWFATSGSHLVGGDLFINLGGGYLPEPGVKYDIFNSYAPDGPDSAGYYKGWFDAIIMDPAWPADEKWNWKFAYTDGETGRGDAPDAGRPFYAASLLKNPEPGTLVMLITGGLGMLLPLWRRRRAA